MMRWLEFRHWWCAGLRRSATLCACVAAFASCIAAAQPPAPNVDPAMPRNVQVVGQPTAGADGQTSWIIDPDVRRTPKIAGLDPQLPPHIGRRLNYAFDLAQRGATYSAAGEFQAVLGLCALELDARSGGTSRRDALRHGLIALDEADQFGGEQLDWRDSADVRRLAISHVTPVLRAQSALPVDSIQAVQSYYAFAERQLTFACGGLPGASLAYYGLARTITVPGTHVAHSSGKAALYYRVALSIAPQNVLAGNELAVLLAQHGQLEESEMLLRHCVTVQPTPDAYRNLAIVLARKGDQRSSQAAHAAGERLAAYDRNSASAVAQAGLVDQPGKAVTPASNSAETDTKSGFLSKFNLPGQLPNIFRR